MEPEERPEVSEQSLMANRTLGKTSLANRRRIRFQIRNFVLPTLQADVEKVVDESSDRLHEQRIFKKYPDFLNYLKQESPHWFETNGGNDQLRSKYRTDFMNLLEFYNIEKKRFGLGSYKHKPRYLYKGKKNESTFFCTECFKRHNPESEVSNVKKTITKKETQNLFVLPEELEMLTVIPDLSILREDMRRLCFGTTSGIYGDGSASTTSPPIPNSLECLEQSSSRYTSLYNSEPWESFSRRPLTDTLYDPNNCNGLSLCRKDVDGGEVTKISWH